MADALALADSIDEQARTTDGETDRGQAGLAWMADLSRRLRFFAASIDRTLHRHRIS